MQQCPRINPAAFIPEIPNHQGLLYLGIHGPLVLLYLLTHQKFQVIPLGHLVEVKKGKFCSPDLIVLVDHSVINPFTPEL